MTREEAIITLTNTASLLRNGTRYMKPEHEKQFREAYEMAIKALEQEQPERKRGKWLLVEESIKVAAYKCSECGRNVWNDMGYDVVKDYPFCLCGADMRGEQE